MSRTEIEASIFAIAEREFETDAPDVEAAVDALDSLQRMQLAAAVEDHFEIRIDAGDEMELRSIGDLTRLVERKLARTERAPS